MDRGVHVIVAGEVQGVGYRYFAHDEAERRRLDGWVRNLRDGRVEAYAEGEEARVQEWLEQLRRGPSAARVQEVLTVWGPARGMRGFEVRPTAFSPEPF